ncbi:hypothetical protein PHSY_004692 [Pseudozyma hubeiensis SY62]|uniref:Uncharacterized protein n=1 Tax=Pseudozyma hubeiensis (strain SY62) TaxID=1305764 RepID=R9P6S4_PSEHS|nr:hypothetical protein PHSY_004692 [Pseudozyma hubeiensis SY62]GAC97108.1 hypothetical protein PHSY_004692 [Pseudozyma hubeiensis SY62]
MPRMRTLRGGSRSTATMAVSSDCLLPLLRLRSDGFCDLERFCRSEAPYIHYSVCELGVVRPPFTSSRLYSSSIRCYLSLPTLSLHRSCTVSELAASYHCRLRRRSGPILIENGAYSRFRID